ncbi:hypothetical protein FB567DRAFT_198314 [Paraphoma chrysanthemicola]|uniref:Peptidase C14 caspase domain-containing protein n=1 Tax=Paraphoma chrysanthemicola TaxID=798071 RepID=A0A8K0VTC6_9PLEO|nr:hypothetical protein FB567DRAFT_198314 [Paraphoma chrysanthemicola]
MAPAIIQDMHRLRPIAPLRLDTGFPPSPSSLSPSEFGQPTDSEEQSKLQECWDKSIAKYMDLPDGYSHVHVLMVKWEDKIDQLEVRQEVNDLTAVFRDELQFDVTEIQLRATKSQLHFESQASTWALNHDSPENLLIIYYAGHGIYDQARKQLLFLPTDEDNSPRVSWNKVEKSFIEDVEADVLGIMDCCYASDLTRSVPAFTRTFEMLAASHVGQTTARPGADSFTRCLIKHLRDLARESAHTFFTTRDIVERIQKDRPDEPPAIWRRLTDNSRHVRLSRLRPLHERPQRNQELANHARFLHLGFALRNEAFEPQHIDALAKQLPKVFKKAGVPLATIKWLGCRNVGVRSFKEVADLVMKYRGNLSAISPAQSSKRSAEEAGLEGRSEDASGHFLRRGAPRVVVDRSI